MGNGGGVMSYLMKNTKAQLVGFIEALQDEIKSQQNKIDNLECAVTEQKDLVAELREELEGSQRVGVAQGFIALDKILAERERQDEKWGQQNHASGTGPTVGKKRWTLYPGLMKEWVDLRSELGSVTWADILMEEIAEAFDESDPGKLEEELIQCAAVIVAWIESIARNRSE